MSNNDNNNSINFIQRGWNFIMGRGNQSQNSNNGQSNKVQMQQQINLQEIIRLQDQDCRNFTLGGLLSGLETIVYIQLPKSQQEIFKKKYDGYNPKSIQEMKIHVIRGIKNE